MASAFAGASLVVEEINQNGTLLSVNYSASVSDFIDFNTPAASGGWSLLLDADVQALVDSEILQSYATRVSLVWTNEMNTESEENSTALIQKKLGVPAISMQVIPEPGSGVLLAMGLAILASRRERRAAA